MDENREQRVRAKRLGDKVDKLSNLPESLLLEVLLNLPTKDVVKFSVLSSRWRNLWKFVPGLDLEYRNFREYDSFVSFIDGFLGFNSESCIQNLKLNFRSNKNDNKPDITHFTRWINTVVDRKVQRLHVSDSRFRVYELQIPPTVYKCESLVSLDLYHVILANPEFVFLPSVKAIYLYRVQFANDSAFEMLISGCPVLEILTIVGSFFNKVLRVCSHSLLRFTCHTHYGKDVVVDAPKLEYLKLSGFDIASFIIDNSPSLVKVNISIWFSTHQFRMTDLQKRNMIHKLLVGISSVKVMVTYSKILEVFYDYSRYEQLPHFCNLSFLDVRCDSHTWEMLLIFLKSCPNLKSLVIVYGSPKGDVIGSLPSPQCFLSSLEFVKIYGLEMKLVSYFLENSAILKKLTLCSDDHTKEILKELLTIPRLSSSCQVVVL